MKRNVRAAYASALRRELKRKHRTLLTTLSPKEVGKTYSDHNDLILNARTVEDGLRAVKEIARFWVEYEDRYPVLARELLRRVRHILACGQAHGKYSGRGSIPTDWIGLRGWSPGALDIVRNYRRRSAKADMLAETAMSETVEQDWDNDNSEYISSVDALALAEHQNRRLSGKKLSATLTRNGPMRHMRRYSSKGTPFRCKVHVGDFVTWLKGLPKLKPDGSDISDEVIEEYLADRAATQGAIREEKRRRRR